MLILEADWLAMDIFRLGSRLLAAWASDSIKQEATNSLGHMVMLMEEKVETGMIDLVLE